MELNARVDVVGRDHLGKRIFRVITDGKLENALFLYEGDPTDMVGRNSESDEVITDPKLALQKSTQL